MWWIWIIVAAIVAQVALLAFFGVRLWRKGLGLMEALGTLGDQAATGVDLLARLGETPRLPVVQQGSDKGGSATR